MDRLAVVSTEIGRLLPKDVSYAVAVEADDNWLSQHPGGFTIYRVDEERYFFFEYDPQVIVETTVRLSDDQLTLYAMGIDEWWINSTPMLFAGLSGEATALQFSNHAPDSFFAFAVVAWLNDTDIASWLDLKECW